MILPSRIPTRFFHGMVTLLLVAGSFVRSPAQNHTTAIDELMTTYHRLGQFNGAVLVAEKGKVIYKKGLGYANMEWQVPIEPDTRFLLGSVSKQFTAMLVLQLVDRGLVSLDSSISTYLSYYPQQTGRRITLHQLLTHSSGIPDITNFPDFDSKYAHRHFKTRALLALFDSLPLEFEPGTAYRYSNTGYSVLGAIVEAVTGQPYKTVLKEFITGPLKMTNTGWADNRAVIPHLACGYQWAALDGYIHPAYFDNSISLGAGGLYSTVEDLYKWDQALFTDQLVSPGLKEKMLSPHQSDYGYGFYIRNWENPNNSDTLIFVEHGGAISGFNTLLFRSVKDKNLIVLLSNTNEAKLGFIRNRLRSILYDRPYDLPEPEPKDIVAAVLRTKGMEAAKAKFWELVATQLDLYGDREFVYQFSQLGYSLVLSGNIEEAIKIYQLNTQAFPNSSKAFDDLGEAYMFKGDADSAIRYYSRALELDPGNVRIAEMLQKLKSN